jgi:hypothetical protein
MQDSRQQALGHVMSKETTALLVASFIGDLLEADKMAAIFSDPVMIFRSCTQLSNGQNKQPKRSCNTGLRDRFINVMAAFMPIIHLLIQLDQLIQCTSSRFK